MKLLYAEDERALSDAVVDISIQLPGKRNLHQRLGHGFDHCLVL